MNRKHRRDAEMVEMCGQIWRNSITSSTQSEGNQPVRPLTVPSQYPPSPMLNTRGADFALPLGRVRSGGHKDSTRDGAVEAPPLTCSRSSCAGSCAGRSRPGGGGKEELRLKFNTQISLEE
ncbi:hypothetical protein EYF80_019764 [Liparis tanakae]|uniref:Uncharacterized protein n=1 Tax=Liparis tanakae TaxID=230148 RepID=A0A4Z2HWP0_9TELE|nr:hypothetical protein EYF80_019764 [Liparis tanakae]